MPAFLIPLLLGLAPTVAEWIAGKPASQVVEHVTEIAKKSIGIDNIDNLESALAADPSKALEFKLAMINAANEEKKRAHEAEMASITAKVDEVKAYISDVQSARSQTVELAKSGSSIAWGAPVVSVLAVAVFAGFVYLLFTQNIQDGMRDALMLLAGTASAAFGAVINYWLGSSAGSAMKTSVMGMMAKRNQ